VAVVLQKVAGGLRQDLSGSQPHRGRHKVLSKINDFSNIPKIKIRQSLHIFHKKVLDNLQVLFKLILLKASAVVGVQVRLQVTSRSLQPTPFTRDDTTD
jgi:hypothetical protein